MSTSFHAALDWGKLLKKEIKAPWKPKLKGTGQDTQYFEQIEEPEENRPYKGTQFYDGSGWDKDFGPFVR